MMLVTLKRIIRAGFLSFRRNGWLSTATIIVLAMMLFVLGNLILLGVLAETVLNTLESKIDVSVYFRPETEEENIFLIKKELESLSEVAEVRYVSREEALKRFREQHKSNALIISALEELGENPLEASLNIRARDPSHYESVSNFLLHKNYPGIDKINYFDNKLVIERLGAILGAIRKGGTALALFLAFVAVLVAFNTIRLAIYTMREEIGIMRLVGATMWFIRGPFIVNGILYGALAAGVTMFVFFPLTWFVSPKLLILVPNFDLFRYFLSNFWEFFGIMLLSGITLGVVSSFIAIRRYLKV